MYFIGVFAPKKTMSILRNTFEGVKGKAIAGGLVAMMSLASLSSATAQDLASADQNQQAAAPTQTFKGKPVTLRVGPGFSLSAADGIAGILEEEGCPTTVTSERGFPMHVTVESNGKTFMFKEIGSAANKASDWCLDKS